jgi:hypothetical protein
VQRQWTSTTLFGLLAVILCVVILVWPGPSIIVAVFGRLLSTLGLGGKGVDVLGLSCGVPWRSSSPSRGRAA